MNNIKKGSMTDANSVGPDKPAHLHILCVPSLSVLSQHCVKQASVGKQKIGCLRQVLA